MRDDSGTPPVAWDSRAMFRALGIQGLQAKSPYEVRWVSNQTIDTAGTVPHHSVGTNHTQDRVQAPLVHTFDTERDLRRVRITNAASIVPRSVDWLWPGWLAARQLHLLAGEAGTGKTTLALLIASILSTGGEWPDGTSCDPGDVLIWSGEDDQRITLVPRLIAAGADMNRVHFVDGVDTSQGVQVFDPAKDMPALCKKARSLPMLRLLILDPIVNAVSGDPHKMTDVRKSLAPVVAVCDQVGAAVLGITHFTKGSSDRSPLDRVIGSQAFGALARIVLVAAKKKNDSLRLVARAKSNIGPDGGGFVYSLDQTSIRDTQIAASVARWGERVDGTALELLKQYDANEATRASEKAAVWLRAILQQGPMPASKVKALAKEAGFAKRTIERASTTLSVESKRVGFGPDSEQWWQLPSPSVAPSADSSAMCANESSCSPSSLFGDHGEDGDSLQASGR